MKWNGLEIGTGASCKTARKVMGTIQKWIGERRGEGGGKEREGGRIVIRRERGRERRREQGKEKGKGKRERERGEGREIGIGIGRGRMLRSNRNA